MKLKYIILKEYNTPIMFPEILQHKDVAGNDNVVSAGFFYVTFDKDGFVLAKPYGESVSLGIKSDPENDTIYLSAALNNMSKGEYLSLR